MLAILVLASACGLDLRQPGGDAGVAGAEPSHRPPTGPATLVAAGDIASCDYEVDSATAGLVDEGATVAILGDAVYPAGSDTTYAQCYGPSWGRLLDRTYPALGNHDAQDDRGAAYFRYFGDRAGSPGEGWYSYDLAGWHVVVLNSNCERIACDPGSPQHDWLLRDLAASAARCTLAYSHHPRFSSGSHGPYEPVGPMWEALADAGADVVLAGHDHLYERFAPQSPDGSADPDGMRQFIVGTGGKELRSAQQGSPNSERLIDDEFGVLRLWLQPASYEWAFVTVDGTVADAGRDTCN